MREVGWITRDTEVERRATGRPATAGRAFYVEQSGLYKGHGLPDAAAAGSGVDGKNGDEHRNVAAAQEIRRTVGSLEQTSCCRTLDAPTAESFCKRSSEVTDLIWTACGMSASWGTRYPIAARQTLFREGGHPDAMYVVLEGSLLVLGDSPEGELVIDQLGGTHWSVSWK